MGLKPIIFLTVTKKFPPFSGREVNMLRITLI